MPNLTLSWTAPAQHRMTAATFEKACMLAVEESARAEVPVQFAFAGYVYIVNAVKYSDEDA